MGKRPGGEMATRPLHFIWICDCSGSMSADGKIHVLNKAIREAIPYMQAAADENPNAQVLVRVIKFSIGAQWHLAKPTPVEEFKWVDLDCSDLWGQLLRQCNFSRSAARETLKQLTKISTAGTDMGAALRMLSDQLKVPPMTDRALPPVLVLLSDGQPTDDFSSGLKALMDQPWGKKAVRIAIAIGEDSDCAVLQKFIGHSELKPLQANNSEALVKHIKWVSTAVLKSASAPASQTKGSPSPGVNVPIPAPGESDSGPSSASDVW